MNDILSNENILVLATGKRDWYWNMQEFIPAIERIGQSRREFSHEVVAGA